MSAKTQYIMLSVEVPDKPVKAESILKITSSYPKAKAVRMIVPTFPGSCTPSK